MKKTIVQIISSAGLGGAEVQLLNVLKVGKPDYRMIVISDDKGPLLENYIALADKVYAIPFHDNHIAAIRKIRTIIRLEKPDYVHNHLWKAILLGSVASLWYPKIGVYNQIHGVLADTDRAKWKLFFYRMFLKFLRYKTRKFITVSDYEIQKLQAEGISSQQLSLLYNTVDVATFTPAPLPYQKGQILKLLYVGRLTPSKGVEYLIAVMQHLKDANIELSIVGDGELRTQLEQQSKELDLDNITFLGVRRDINTLMATHHVLVAPSLWEVFGIVLAEAMAMAKPIIATEVGGIPELIIHEKGGYLCPPADAMALKDAIIKLEKQAEKMEAFGAFNRKRVETHFSLEYTTNRLKELYQ